MDQALPNALSTVPDLYQFVEDLVVSLHDAPRLETLAADSLALKSELMPLVQRVQGKPAPGETRAFTIKALRAGMMSGALDGASLYQTHRITPQPDFASDQPHLQSLARTLKNNLEQVLLVAQTNWGNSHVDDLQLLSGYGKHQNLQTLEEGEELVNQGGFQASDLQAFLMATFKGGYAMGVADAAVMFVGGERPGAPPRSPAGGE